VAPPTYAADSVIISLNPNHNPKREALLGHCVSAEGTQVPTAPLSDRGSLCDLNGSLCVRRGHLSAHCLAVAPWVTVGSEWVTVCPQRALKCPLSSCRTVGHCRLLMGHCVSAEGTQVPTA
jgi:hypothetical protein